MESKSKPHPLGARRRGLESHVAFFDADHDGIIWPIDTYNGMREIGFNIFIALLATVIIHTGFSWPTSGTLLPDPFFRIRVSNIHGALHGSDTGSFTQTGDLDERRFDYVFSLYTAPPHTHMTFKEGVRMLHGNRNVLDLFGWIAAAGDWGATYLLLWPADGRVAKQDVHDVIDGSLFAKLAQKNSNSNSNNVKIANTKPAPQSNKNVNGKGKSAPAPAQSKEKGKS